MKCPKCGSTLMQGYALEIQAFHLECTGCDWMANIKDWDISGQASRDAKRANVPLGSRHFRGGWREAPFVRASELVSGTSFAAPAPMPL